MAQRTGKSLSMTFSFLLFPRRLQIVIFDASVFRPGNGSPSATNVVVFLVLVLGVAVIRF